MSSFPMRQQLVQEVCPMRGLEIFMPRAGRTRRSVQLLVFGKTSLEYKGATGTRVAPGTAGAAPFRAKPVTNAKNLHIVLTFIGQHVKGSVRQVADLLRDILTTKLKRLGAAVKLIGETGAGPDGGETSISLKVLSMGPQATCEASFEITSLLEGFARVSCRRLIGKTTMFHRFYNVYLNAMRETQPYIHADD
eukprot:Hpha_TRINITY_DN15463_c2_g4::TRINITY_DN15463_c2_g4_i1::g.175406::m.175406